MKTYRTTACVISAFFLLFLATHRVVSQGANKITAAEYIEANELSHKFDDRFLKTKDIAVLIKDFYVGDFVERSLKNNYDRVGLLLDREMIPNSRIKNLRRYFITETNFIGRWFYYQHTLPKSKNDTGDIYGLFPANVRRYLKKNRYGRFVQDQIDVSAKFDKPLSEKEKEEIFDNTLYLMETVNRMLLRSISNLSPSQRVRSKKNFEAMSRFTKPHEPDVSECHSACYGFPQSTRMFYVRTSLFQLTLVKQNGQMKVINLDIISN